MRRWGGGKRSMQSWRSLRHRPMRRRPQRPPPELCCDPHTPTRSMRGAESESRPLVPSPAPRYHSSTVTANGLTGAPSPRHLHPSLHCRAHTPLQSLHPFPLLSTAAAPCTETGSSTRASAPRFHLPATSTPYSTRTSRTSEWRQAQRVELLVCTHVQGKRRSPAGASHR